MLIHFIGIGGIGVSALARYYLKKGHRVSGSDGTRSEITDALRREGARVFIGEHKASHVPASVDRVVYSPAVSKDNPELLRARELATKIEAYPETLGELTKEYYTIAIAGTHGKSTTTAMIGLLLAKAGFDPTVIVGTLLKEFGGLNCRVGRGKKLVQGKPVLVIEADEHFGSFLNYWPSMVVLTTIEADHLDYYKNLANVVKAFGSFVARLPKGGVLVCNEEDENTQKIINHKFQTHPYSIKQKEAEILRRVLKVPGEHNVANALAALGVARALGVADEASLKALGAYRGAWRRFETFRLQKPRPYTLISDYGHHPTEIRATVEGAREQWPFDSVPAKSKKIWLVYQPHQYQRAHTLFKDFTRVLSSLPIDRLILVDVYDVPGREGGGLKEKAGSAALSLAVQKKKPSYPVLHIPAYRDVEAYLAKEIRGGEVVMVMGAGDIYNLTVRLTKRENKGQ